MSVPEIKKAVQNFEGRSKGERVRLVHMSQDYKAVKDKNRQQQIMKEMEDALKKIKPHADACAKAITDAISNFKNIKDAPKDVQKELDNAVSYMSGRMIDGKSMLKVDAKLSGSKMTIACSVKK